MKDSFVFKKLAHNDTGAAVGHQGGMVIPKAIAEFFPPLPSVPNAASPTVDTRLRAHLFVDDVLVAVVNTRYQHQTWGGTRSAERRLTDNLGPLRDLARRDDYTLFSKDLFDDEAIEVRLYRKGTEKHAQLESRFGNLRWGIVDVDDPPVSNTELKAAEEYIEKGLESEATIFSEDRRLVKSLTMRRARDRAFRKKLLELYEGRCAFTDRGYSAPLPERSSGLDAAHIVPVHANGSDHPSNGLALSKDLHWAFDKGLIGVDENRKITVPETVISVTGNGFLASLHGTPIREPSSKRLAVSDEALSWHRKNVLL